jgi:hypothetical protein
MIRAGVIVAAAVLAAAVACGPDRRQAPGAPGEAAPDAAAQGAPAQDAAADTGKDATQGGPPGTPAAEPAPGGAGAQPATTPSASGGTTGATSGGTSGGTTGAAPAGASAPAEPNHREVLLFFSEADEDALAPERRRIVLADSIAEQARSIVTELAAGPHREGLLPTVPKGTTVLDVYLDRYGTAWVNLSEEFVSLHPGGSDEELATVFSIVNSLTYNLKEIRKVRFLVGGEERDTLKSHLDLRRAYLQDMSLVQMNAGDAGPAGGRR